MPREQGGTSRGVSRKSGKTSRASKRHFTPESKERLIAGARKGGQHSAGTEKHYTPESKERQISGARKGGQHSAGTVKHYTPESKERQITGARKGGQHSHVSAGLARSAASRSVVSARVSSRGTRKPAGRASY